MSISLKKLGVLGAIAAVLVLFAVVQPGVNTKPAEADFQSPGGISAIPSAAPAIPGLTDQNIPAIIPASGSGNEAIITVFIDGFNGVFTDDNGNFIADWVDACKADLSLVDPDDRCRITFEVAHLNLATGELTDTNAAFLANGSDTLNCSDDSSCDVDGLNNGVIAVKMRGGGVDEMLVVTATDETGDVREVQVLATQTMQVIPPVLEPNSQVIPGLQDIALVSYSCGTNIGRSVFPDESVATLEDFWIAVYGPSVLMATVPADTGHLVFDTELQEFVIVPMTSNNPFFRCGGDTDTTVDDQVSFETDMGILSIDALQVVNIAGVVVYPFISSDDCDEGDSVTVADGGIFTVDEFLDSAADETCDLDAAPNGVVTYAVQRTASATGVATLQAQQGTIAASSRSTPLDFIGVATLALDLSGIPDTIDVLGDIPIDIVVLSTESGTGPAPVQGIVVSCSVDPANAAFALLPDRDTTDAQGTANMVLISTGLPGTTFTVTCSLDGHPEVAPVSKEVAVVLPGQENLETVDLVEGCNPVSSTWPDGTTAAAAADDVAPPEALNALWKFDPVSGSWQGFDPAAPAGVSNLASIDFLDVVFICVSDAATWSRPAIS